MLARALLLFIAMLGLAASAGAHEIRPAFLQIREIEPSTLSIENAAGHGPAAYYDIVWKTPAQGDMRLALNVILPFGCQNAGEPRTTLVDAAVIQRWRSACSSGLAGQRISIENLDTSLTDVLLHFEPLSGEPRTLRLDGATPRAEIPMRQSAWKVAGTYFRLGIEHILLGFDHLLFVFCLLLLVGNFQRLLGAVTAFTLAHSITLAGTTFGWLRLASAPVEACIALSIAFVAAEIIKARDGRTGATGRWPWLASFSFGLLHGFGFASALREIGLPEGAVPSALLFFNLGVEAGQILFLSAVLAGAALWRRLAPKPPQWLWQAPPYFAGSVACYWLIERTMRILL